MASLLVGSGPASAFVARRVRMEKYIMFDVIEDDFGDGCFGLVLVLGIV